MRVVKRKGTIALEGEEVDAIAAKWIGKMTLDVAFTNSLQSRNQRDGEHYHITIFSPQERKNCEIDASNLVLDDASLRLMDIGVGKQQDCYYVIIYCPKLQKMRAQYKCAPCDLHITLGFAGSDVHDVSKSIDSLYFSDDEMNFVSTAESILSAPSSRVVQSQLHYKHIAELAMRRGYLFGAYYTAKFLGNTHAAYDILEEAALTQEKCKYLNCATDYGSLVCQALNTNIVYSGQLHRLKRFYASKINNSAASPHYEITYQEFPRNFSFVSEKLAGSSIFSCREDIHLLECIGITDVITVMETPLPVTYFQGTSINSHHFHVIDRTPPTMQQMLDIMAICDAAPKVCVHCMGGVGRTATVLAGHIMWSTGASRHEALMQLQQRKTILSVSQETFLSDWYMQCKQNTAKLSVQLPPLIMCVGYPASGKSTFCQALVEAFPGRVTRLNQDELGRKQCENEIGKLCKKSCHSVLLDRCNLTTLERREWLALSQCKRAWVIHFTASPEECKWRIVRRRNHPTIKEGGGSRIIASLEGILESPQLNEGFEQVIQVGSFDACNALLQEWGCDNMPTSTIPEEEGLLKFPRTRHVLNVGSATRDDLILAADEVETSFLHRRLYVEEKIDGANMGLSIRNNTIVAQNRSHFVSSAYHPQFKHLDKWIHKHSNELWCLLESDRYVLYGEWVYARHSIHYAALPDYFIAFDMYDRLEGKFWSRAVLEERLAGTSIALVPLIAQQSFTSTADLLALLKTKSKFYDGLVEGVYLRLCDSDDLWTIDRGKIVRSDFMCGNEFWSKGGVVANGVLH